MRHRLPLPGRALVAVVRGDDAGSWPIICGLGSFGNVAHVASGLEQPLVFARYEIEARARREGVSLKLMMCRALAAYGLQVAPADLEDSQTQQAVEIKTLPNTAPASTASTSTSSIDIVSPGVQLAFVCCADFSPPAR
jgi:hypothetical protein